VIFIDIRKAFDTISHELLPLKLQAVGIMGNSYNWILDYLKDRSQFTTVNGSSSSTKPINYGVPQGSLLGPRLYSIYVNDLPDAVTEGEVEMYADDTTAYCIVDNFDIVTQRLNLIFLNKFTGGHKEKDSRSIMAKVKLCSCPQNL